MANPSAQDRAARGARSRGPADKKRGPRPQTLSAQQREITDLAEAQKQALDGRRAALRQAFEGNPAEIAGIPAVGSLGLALSGGGVRSACISLGVAQALVGMKRLYDFDYLSTVSGGGYFGSFLGTLHVPPEARGLPDRKRPPPTAANLERQRKFAELVLGEKSRETLVSAEIGRDGKERTMRNPIWWLREHSRYLAPNGPTDYLQALTIMVRNWLAMMYVFGLPAALGGLLLIAADAFAKPGGGATSPVFWLFGGLLFLATAVGTSFWFTEWQTRDAAWHVEPPRAPSWLRFLFGTVLTLLTFVGLLLFLFRFHRWLASWPKLFLGAVAILGVLAVVFAVGVATAYFAMLAWRRKRTSGAVRHPRDPDHFINEQRRLTTNLETRLNALAGGVLAVALYDTAARWLVMHVSELTLKVQSLGFFGVLTPVVVWLFTKLPDLAGKGEGWVQRAIRRHLWTVALVAAVAMYSLLVISIWVAIRLLTLPPDNARQVNVLSSPDVVEPVAWLSLFAVGLVAIVATGVSTGFINLSSLHGFYRARLSRAFLGGSNTRRLIEAERAVSYTPVTENHPQDDMDVAAYQQLRTAAPLHLINVTLNETRNREGSQLVERDRKGVPMVFGPEGMLLDAGRDMELDAGPERRSYFSWRALKGVERLTLGQLCAISGAAASAGMGANTTLGGALALTFANVRLGYWWNVGKTVRDSTAHSSLWQKLYVAGTVWLRTYFYLANEMTGRYSRDYQRLYLSDGGHFENTAAYELLRRRCKVIVICDNGADPRYEFGDLENLVRKARLDLGMSLNVLTLAQVTSLYGANAKDVFCNVDEGDWRAAARDRDNSRFAVMLGAFEPKATSQVSLLLWIKPKVFAGLTEDVVGYGKAHKQFPSESTGDQFFDEEQWESYRALGLSLIQLLATKAEKGADFLRYMAEDGKPELGRDAVAPIVPEEANGSP